MADKIQSLTTATDLTMFMEGLGRILYEAGITVTDDDLPVIAPDELDRAEMGVHRLRNTIAEWPFYHLYEKELAPELAWADNMLVVLAECRRQQSVIDTVNALKGGPQLLRIVPSE